MRRRTARFSAVLSVLVAAIAARHAAVVLAAGSTAQQPAASAQFHFGGNVAEIPARFVDYLVFLPAGVNQSQPSLLQLDTTAAASTIDSVRAAELGITTLQSPVLNMSGVDFSLASLTETSRKDFGAQVGRPYEGSLGKDFLDGAIVEINYVRQTVRLFDPATYKYSGKGKSLRLNFVAGLPVLHARLAMGDTKAAEGDFVLDTTLDASLIVSQKFSKTHKLLSHVKTIHSVDFLPNDGAFLVRAREFDIGGSIPVAAPIVVFSSGSSLANSDARFAGEIGGAMLRRFVVTLDYPHQQVYFDASSEIRVEEVEDMSGIALAAGGPDLKRFEVTQVWPGTPGADAKIQKGDVIAGINDEAAADMSLAEIRRLFRQPAVKYRVLLQRGPQTMTVNLQMRRQLGY